MELLKKYNNNFHHNLDFYHTPNRTYSLGTTFVQVHHFFTLSKADTKAASSLNVSLISSENFLWIPSNSSIYCCGPYKWILEKWVLSHYVNCYVFHSFHYLSHYMTARNCLPWTCLGFKQGLLRVVTCVPSQNFKICCFAYWGGSHVTAVGNFTIVFGLLSVVRCRSFNLSLCHLSPFLLSYVTVSKPCQL